MSEVKKPVISILADSYPPSGIRKMFNLAMNYPDAIKLTVGEPNFETPQYIKDAAKKAIDDGFTKYSSNAGEPALREAVAAKYQKFYPGYTADNVAITVGAMEALMMAMLLVLDPGDEIIVPDPCFPNYFGMAMIAGGKAVAVPTYEEYDYRLQAEDVEKFITPRTKAILLNSPCNPTGAVLTREDIRKISDLACRYNLWILSDEPYEAILYDGNEHISMAEIDEIRDRVIIHNSFSKSYAMTGWRIGYMVTPNAELTQKVCQLQEPICSCVATFVQMAAIEALKSTECITGFVRDYTRRRDILIDGLNAIPGITCHKVGGSFYAFPNISAFGKPSREFAMELLTEAGVVTVPGVEFGQQGEGHLRLSFANSDENLRECVKRIAEYTAKAYPEIK